MLNTTLPIINQVNSWTNSAQQWASRTASDWGSCPSPGAQQSYNQLQSWQNNVEASIQQAEQIRSQAEDARTTCLSATNNAPLCHTTFNELPVHGWLNTLNATNTTIEASLNAMRNLQCPAGCSQSVSLDVPSPRIESNGFYSFRNPGMVDVDLCTKLDLGEIGFNPSAVASGNVNGVIEADLPSCSATQTVSACTNWDLRALLPQLQRLRIVPPEVGEISLDIPNRSLNVVTGAQTARCQRPLQVCVPGGNVSISFNEGGNLFEQNTTVQCADRVTVACQQPPFGILPTTQRLQVPDLTRAQISWTGPKPGRVEVDLTRRDLRRFCLGRGRTALRIPRPPRVSVGSRTVDLPFLCTQLNWQNVVANQ